MTMKLYCDKNILLGCDYYSFSTGLFGMVSIGTLTAMAIERYIVCHNFVHMHWSVKYKCYVIGGTWLYGFMMVLPPLFGWGRYSIDLYKPSCTFDYYSSDWNTKSFAIFLLVCGFVIPASIILYCYSGMFKNIVANERNMRAMSLRPILGRLNSSGSNANHNEPKKIPLLKRRKSASLSELDKLCRGGVSRLSRRRHHSISFNDILLVLNNQTIQPQTSCWQFGSLSRRNETQFAKLILMVILGFFACWTPYAILTILCQLRVEAAFSPTAAAVTLLFAKSSCAINPIIYGLKEKKFRQEIFKIFGG